MDHEHNLLDATELRLGLPGTAASTARGNKRASDEMDDNCSSNRGEAKIQVVGWPPVRSYGRRNTTIRTRKAEQQGGEDGGAARIYVKVSMDGAPYLRKIDLKVYKGYKELRVALEDMFSNSFALGEYVITFQDKDGDWMMVGDVPFQMFFSTCKRLRIMKGSEARGLTSTT